jgi:hypothetical protein
MVWMAMASSVGTVDAWYVLASVLPEVLAAVPVAAAMCVVIVSMLDSSLPTKELKALLLGAYPIVPDMFVGLTPQACVETPAVRAI